MGDPKKTRKKYETPRHPWEKERIVAEKEIVKKYGLKNKKEVWRASSLLKKFKAQAKIFATASSEQDDLEKSLFIGRLKKYGYLNKESGIDDVLGLELKDIVARRLQTLVLKKKFALTIGQARQLIVHGHITVNGKKISSPSYKVSLDEESAIDFADNSPVSNEAHAIKKDIAAAAAKEQKIKVASENNPKAEA